MGVNKQQLMVILISVTALATSCDNMHSTSFNETPVSINQQTEVTSAPVSNTDNKKTDSAKYKNPQLGFQLTFPKSWEGKYEIVESKTEIKVFYKPINKNAEKASFFSIDTWGSSKEWDLWWEKEGKEMWTPFNKVGVINENVFVSFTPTEAIYQGQPEFEEDATEYDKLSLDVDGILKSFKPIEK